MSNIYTPVIGLEVHVELKTNSKMFCGCTADYFGQKPNSHTCPVCLGLPGALPVPNQKAIEWCIKIGLALGCKIPFFAKFDRKNYFYPDLPKGYQISQYDEPFCLSGQMILTSGKKIGITRVHMEEDTGKLLHEEIGGEKTTLIDFNRSGVPLVEIVTEPDFDNAKDVKEYLQRLQQIVRYLGVSDADMEKGNMRLEPNISLRKNGQKELPNYKVEVKNINSFSFVTKAIDYEIKRQAELLGKNERPPQETRGWDEFKQKTVSQRLKEEANDYRYFPEPDIPPLRWTEKQVKDWKETLPELPAEKQERFQSNYALSPYDAEIVTRTIDYANYFEEAVKIGKQHEVSPKQIANYLINKKPSPDEIMPAKIIEIIKQSSTKVTIDEDILKNAIDTVIKEQEKAVLDYKSGKETVIMFLVGQVMRKLQIKADASLVLKVLKQSLQE